MLSCFSKCSKFDEDLKNGEKKEKIFLLFQIIAFEIVRADSKYKKENTCDRQSRF